MAITALTATVVAGPTVAIAGAAPHTAPDRSRLHSGPALSIGSDEICEEEGDLVERRDKSKSRGAGKAKSGSVKDAPSKRGAGGGGRGGSGGGKGSLTN